MDRRRDRIRQAREKDLNSPHLEVAQVRDVCPTAHVCVKSLYLHHPHLLPLKVVR